jgi:hypothetical protein
MTPRVKQMVKNYLQAVDINTVKKSKRIPLIKECIFKLNHLEESGLLDKMRIIYPMMSPKPGVPIQVINPDGSTKYGKI